MTRLTASGSISTGGRAASATKRKAISRMRLAEQDERFLDDRVEIARCHLDRRQARERGELVHQPLQLLDLTDDRAGALVEQGPVLSAELARRSACAGAARTAGSASAGFLISCAMRRATSRHASMRCTRRRCVTSSKNSMIPRGSPFSSSSVVAVIQALITCGPPVSLTCSLGTFLMARLRRRAISSPTFAGPDDRRPPPVAPRTVAGFACRACLRPPG